MAVDAKTAPNVTNARREISLLDLVIPRLRNESSFCEVSLGASRRTEAPTVLAEPQR